MFELAARRLSAVFLQVFRATPLPPSRDYSGQEGVSFSGLLHGREFLSLLALEKAPQWRRRDDITRSLSPASAPRP